MTMRTNWAVKFGGCLLALAVMLLVSVPAQAQSAGEKLYKAKCAGCHGPDGTASTAAGKATKTPSICTEDAAKATDAEWTEIITKGKNKMPAYDKKLTETEIKDVIAYMRSLCKK